MLDCVSWDILSAIKKMSPQGGYVVVTAEDISSSAGLRGVTPAELGQVLIRLSSMGYIDLRFYDDGEYCCTVLKKGEECEHPNACKSGFFARNRALITLALTAFLAAFLGAFIGGGFF